MHWMLDGALQNYPQQLQGLVERAGPLAVPGAYNPMAALMARDVGFDALYFSGAAFSAGLGIPDIGIFTLDQLTQIRDANAGRTSSWAHDGRNSDAWTLEPGQTRVLADIDGPEALEGVRAWKKAQKAAGKTKQE